MINGLTTEHQGLADSPECKDQESYYVFPWSLLITVLSSRCCGVNLKRVGNLKSVDLVKSPLVLVVLACHFLFSAFFTQSEVFKD